MTEQKHTPGPWIATRILGGWWIEEDNDPTAFYRRRIAGVAGGAGIDSPAANARLLAAAPELLAALKACCIATQGKQKAFCECFQHDSRPCLDMEGVCWFKKNGNCHIWRAIQKASGLE